HGFLRHQHGFDDVVDGRARAEAAQIGSDATTRAADRMTRLAGELGAAIDQLPAARVTLCLHVELEPMELLSRGILRYAWRRERASDGLERGIQGVGAFRRFAPARTHRADDLQSLARGGFLDAASAQRGEKCARAV